MPRSRRDLSVAKVVVILLIVAVITYVRRNGSRSPATGDSSQVNGYDELTNCTFVPGRGNDGDSFRVRHGEREFVLRLYYVDAPETYLSDRHASQRERVQEQANDFGGIRVEQAIATGKNASEQTERLLNAKPFTVYTRWERVFDSERVYGFARPDGSDVFLSETLATQGLAAC